MTDVSGSPVRVAAIDHVVINASDPAATVAWFAEHLGLRPERQAEFDEGTAPFVSLRVDPGTVIDVFGAERTGENVDHVSLRVADDVDLHSVAASGRFDVEAGPMRIWGAFGYGWGLYVRDPDGNRIELKHYGDADDREAP